MTHEDFHVNFFKLLDTDCKKGPTSTTSRTLTDEEARKLCQHFYEWFVTEIVAVDDIKLCHILVRTEGKFKSQQDRALRIKDELLKEG